MAQKLFFNLRLDDGTMDGLLTITSDIKQFTMMSCPKDKYGEILARTEGKSGIYFLVSKEKIYVGKSDRNIKSRLSSHYANKNWWNRIIFTETPNNVDISYLEYFFHKKAMNLGNYDIDNIQKIGKPNLDDYKEDLSKVFAEDVLTVLEIIGIDLFKEKKSKRKNSFISTALKEKRKTFVGPVNEEFYFKGKPDNAKLKIKSNSEFVVLQGSSIKVQLNSYGRTTDIRNEAKEKGWDGLNVLNIDVSFKNPGTAGIFVSGSSAHGWKQTWRTTDGKNIDDVIVNY